MQNESAISNNHDLEEYKADIWDRAGVFFFCFNCSYMSTLSSIVFPACGHLMCLSSVLLSPISMATH